MSDNKSKLGIFIIVVILSITGILIVTKTKESTLAPTSETPADIPAGMEVYEEDLVASSSSLSSPIPAPVSLREYAYPNAKEVKSTSRGFILESTDSVQLITDWYRSQINTMDFNAKSFTQSRTDDEVLNKISAAKPGENLEVTIKKDQTTSITEITVDRL